MEKIYYVERKKFFEERYQEFRKAYYAWARYDPYKRYGKPDEKKAHREAEKAIEELSKERFVMLPEYVIQETTKKIIKERDQKIREKGKQDKKVLREDLKKAFKNLF